MTTPEPYEPTHRADVPVQEPVEPPAPQTPLSEEPAITVGSISAVVSAVIALAVVLGVKLPDGFEAAVVAVIAAAGPIVGSIITRRYVTPVGRADG